MRDIIRKILKEQTEVVIPDNKKVYVDKVLKRWETDSMRTKQFIDVYGIDTDMALYIRQKIQEDLRNIPVGKKIWLLDKDFPLDVGIGNYDFKFEITDIFANAKPFPPDPNSGDIAFDNYVAYEKLEQKRLLLDEIQIDVTIYPEGSVHINVQEEDDEEYELKEFSIYDAIGDNDFGWEVESEIKEIIWEYVMSFSPLLKKVRPEIQIVLSDDKQIVYDVVANRINLF